LGVLTPSENLTGTPSGSLTGTPLEVQQELPLEVPLELLLELPVNYEKQVLHTTGLLQVVGFVVEEEGIVGHLREAHRWWVG
jgi:hypothetical protein